ncbi:hypothetical protein DYB37_002424 [Aphanomyces astaci]|uniref:Peptidase M48 domain-containing protein n=1 Tax=Aphanomyces astaci TaxID=112090 RepID=A0A3R7AY69_APHAT|nr:hypothetical protein DYB35_003488 [Aphanomyces astaci]RHZ28833.1 hypothetical protein DYB37_002424 [Aphanomyces astaci]
MPISNRSHFVFLSHDDEQALADEAVANILAEEGNMCLKRGDPVYDAVLEVTQHLAAICEDQHLSSSSTSFTLHVIDSPIANVFFVPNGTIFVYTGILPIAKTYGDLACVLGHEMPHAMAHHSAEKIGYFDLVLVLYEFLRGVSDGTSDVGGRGWKAALMEFLLVTVFQVPLAFSRRMEGEADRMGMVLAARTGYDPREGSPLWKRMMDATMETPPSRESGLHVAAPEAFLGDLLSNNPSSQSRMHDLYEYATTILWEFQLATDKLAFAQVMRDSTALLPLISTAEKRVVTNDEGQAVDPGWEFKSELARRNACLMGGDKGHAIRALLEEVGLDGAQLDSFDT